MRQQSSDSTPPLEATAPLLLAVVDALAVAEFVVPPLPVTVPPLPDVAAALEIDPDPELEAPPLPLALALATPAALPVVIAIAVCVSIPAPNCQVNVGYNGLVTLPGLLKIPFVPFAGKSPSL